MKKNPIVEVQNLEFEYENTKIFQGISFKVDSGDFLGLIGPNGSGKTTLVKLILGLYKAKKGQIRLFGDDIEDFKHWSRIGYVPQKATNIEKNFPATVKEVVGMGLLSNKRLPKIYDEKDNKKIKEALKKVYLEEYENKRIGELSGGQQQRAFIARAIISDPDILVLDEPTTGVDEKTQKRFYELLDDFNKKGMTIILISHDIGRITKYVTKVASINRSIQFYGSHEDFCSWDKKHHHKTDREHKLCLYRG